MAATVTTHRRESTLQHALGYHRRGWSVVPVIHGEKRPAYKWQNYQQAPPTEDQLRRWFDPSLGGRFTDMAVVLGSVSGRLAVRDFDDGDAYARWAGDYHEYASVLPTVRTARGCHVYLRLPDDSPITGTVKMEDGELRAAGSIVLLPPSCHPSGAVYEWIVPLPEGDLVEIDPDEIGLLTTPGAANRDTPTGSISEGQRNLTLTSMAGTMRRRGMTEQGIRAALCAENAARCSPPLPDAEVHRIAASVARYKPAASPIMVSEHRTDLGNARRFVARHGTDLHFVYPWKKWLHWDGRRWTVDGSGEVMRRAKETMGCLYQEAAEAPETDRRALAQWAIRSEAEQRLKAMVSLAQSEPGIPVSPEQLDQNKWLFNCENGTIDLRSGQRIDHDRSHLITKVAAARFDPDAVSARWEAFLYRVFEGNRELIGFVQRAAGYALTGETYEHCLFILYGSGRNGKSTLLESLAALWNDYAQQTPTETLLASPGQHIPNDVAKLKGARLVTAVEVAEGRRLNEALVKQLTGGDRVTARFMRSEFFEFVPQCKLFLAVNHRPEIRGTDNAIWERIKLIPFNVTIRPEERDKILPEKLKQELPGILAWAVQGCRAWQECGLGDPREVVGATQAYRQDMDILGAFLAEQCLLDANAQCASGQLYKAYTEWCQAVSEKPLRQKDFVARLRERGLKKEKSSVMTWRGIGLITRAIV